jgi:hypothetical protein
MVAFDSCPTLRTARWQCKSYGSRRVLTRGVVTSRYCQQNVGEDLMSLKARFDLFVLTTTIGSPPRYHQGSNDIKMSALNFVMPVSAA